MLELLGIEFHRISPFRVYAQPDKMTGIEYIIAKRGKTVIRKSAFPIWYGEMCVGAAVI